MQPVERITALFRVKTDGKQIAGVQRLSGMIWVEPSSLQVLKVSSPFSLSMKERFTLEYSIPPMRLSCSLTRRRSSRAKDRYSCISALVQAPPGWSNFIRLDIESKNARLKGIRWQYHGVPTIIVSLWLGHSMVNITLDQYGHLIPEIQNEAAELIDGLR